MPTSRRDKKVELTKVQKHAPKKKQHVAKVRQYLDEYKRVYVVTLHNPRTQKVSEIRKNMPDIKLIPLPFCIILFRLLFGINKVTVLALGKTHKDSYRPKLHHLCKYLKGQCALLFTKSSPSELREQLDAFRSAEYCRPGAPAEQTKLFQIEMSEFRVGLLAVWTDGDGVEELEEKDSCLMRTSLHPEVIVVCKQLDDGLYYFIPQPCENKNESSVNEAMEED
ncbi:mRNA turnover protein 4 [Schistosoma japonicum]|nr:mRNA turnover protein 4 [Schistosoma japonicum]